MYSQLDISFSLISGYHISRLHVVQVDHRIYYYHQYSGRLNYHNNLSQNYIHDTIHHNYPHLVV